MRKSKNHQFRPVLYQGYLELELIKFLNIKNMISRHKP